MGSPLFLFDLLTAHEPKMRKCLEINERSFRFMESLDLQNWMHFEANRRRTGTVGESSQPTSLGLAPLLLRGKEWEGTRTLSRNGGQPI